MVAFQLERAALRLQLAVEDAATDADEADTRHEILMSRLPLIEQGSVGALLRSDPAAAEAGRRVGAALRAFDAAVAAAPGAAERIALYRTAGAAIGEPATELTLAAVHLTGSIRTREADGLLQIEIRLGGFFVAAAVAAFGLFALLALQARRLAAERRVAEAASAAKTTFLANISHELRTPLNGVLGMLDLLAREPLPAPARDRAVTARQSAQQLLSVIGDILDMTKLEAGRMELEAVPFSLEAVLRRCHATFAAAAEAKGVELRLALEPEAAGWFLGDAARLAQIVNNLLANAVKFTDRGTVSLAARLVPDAEGRRAVLLCVRDTGIGIAPAAMQGLFAKFSQADASTTRRFGGTGLGLAICQELAGLMGGRIDVTSRPGAGTTVRVTLPLPLAAAPAAPVPAPPRPAAPRAQPAVPRRVLVAEDDRVGRMVASAFLEQLGADVTLAENGRLAVERAAAERFDLILMDIQMPELDGLEATRRIRAGDGPNRAARIVALSANAFGDDVARSLEAGMDGHLSKPVSRDALAEVVRAAAPGTCPDAAPPAPTSGAMPSAALAAADSRGAGG